jgi:heptosyltransferase-2
MVACDGGIMHTSVAVGTPTAGIFGSSQSSVWFPYAAFGAYRAAEIDVPCRPCHQHVCPLGHTRCLNELTPAYVASILQSIARAPVRPAT